MFEFAIFQAMAYSENEEAARRLKAMMKSVGAKDTNEGNSNEDNEKKPRKRKADVSFWYIIFEILI